MTTVEDIEKELRLLNSEMQTVMKAICSAKAHNEDASTIKRLEDIKIELQKQWVNKHDEMTAMENVDYREVLDKYKDMEINKQNGWITT